MRNDARRFLNRMEVKHPGTKYTVYQTGIKIKSQNQDDKIINYCGICGAPTTEEICRTCILLRKK